MPDATSRPDPFALDIPLQSRLSRAAFAAARPFLSRALGLDALRDLYGQAASIPAETFEARVLRALDIEIEAASAAGEAIPAHGPLIVAANHPTGALDGLVLMETVRRTRADVRIVSNHLLARFPELAGSCFFVDPFGGAAAAARSRAGLRAAHLWLRHGGAIAIFPAGAVASRLADGPWHETVGRLARATGARVVPVFLAGGNSRAFHAAGRIRPALRTLLLGRELLNKRSGTARVLIGRPLDAPDMGRAASPAAATSLIRSAVEDLRRLSARAVQPAEPVALEAPVDPEFLDADVRALPGSALLLSCGALDVYCAGAAMLPHVLREIGRLREATFRAVGEGTGHGIDLDRFDRHYDHLFVWHRVRREVVGAYRVADTQRVAGAHGVAGLYTRTLFRYDERLLDRIGPAIELGRSFVRAEYQRSHLPLLLLWKGIGRLIAAAPDRRVLFGPVSISSHYRNGSHEVLRAYLARHHAEPGLAPLVEAVNPPTPMAISARASAATDIESLDALVARVEGGRGIPVLLRQYMRLRATLLGFNVDPAFGNALDALMMVDIDRMSASARRRYLGDGPAVATSDQRAA